MQVWVNLGLTLTSCWVHLDFCSALQSSRHSVLTAFVPLAMASFGGWMRFLQKSSNCLFKALQVWREQLDKVLLQHCQGSQYHFGNDWTLVSLAVLQNYFKEMHKGHLGIYKSNKWWLRHSAGVQAQSREETCWPLLSSNKAVCSVAWDDVLILCYSRLREVLSFFHLCQDIL